MASSLYPKGSPIGKEGPCLVIEWRDKKNGRGWVTSRYFPLDDTTTKDAELSCFEWFRQRRCEIRSMTWAWGPVSPNVTKRHRLVINE